MTKDSANESNEAFVVTRRIPVAVPDTVLAGLNAQPGVASAALDGHGSLKLRYDASRIGFPEIETILDEAGVARPAGLAWRIRAEWYRFTDGNARANAHATHACCSRPPVPPGGGRAK